MKTLKHTNLKAKFAKLIFAFIIINSIAVNAQTAEVEPNNNKVQATAVTVTGTGTGASFATGTTTGNVSTAGATSTDYFKLTFPVATAGIYENIITISSSTAGHTISIRGLSQSAFVIGTTDATVQASNTTALGNVPARSVKFYSFGKGEQLYIRIDGTVATTAAYDLNWTRTAVSPIIGPTLPALLTDNVTWTSVGQTTIDTDIWIYDSNFNPISGFGNDDEPTPGNGLQSRLTRQYPSYGTYYVAIGRFNLSNNLASPVGDGFSSGVVLDFPGAVVSSAASSPNDLDLAYYINANTPTPLPVNGGATPNGYAVAFVQFTLASPCASINLQGNGNNIVSGSNTTATTNKTDFGSVVKISSTTFTYTIQNTGATTLNVGAITITGANPGDFTVTTAPAATVAANSSTTFVVKFKPLALGARSAVISIANNGCTNPYTFAVSGNGINRPPVTPSN